MRLLVGFLLLGLVGLALVIYDIKYDTRDLDARADELRRAVQEERDAIAVLRAEWSLLNRPDRVERLARKHLGLEPLQAQRMIGAEALDMQRPTGSLRRKQADGGGPEAAPPETVTH